MANLTNDQLNKLGVFVSANDRHGYYTTLASYGVIYAALADGVVQQNTYFGRITDLYFRSQAGFEGVSVTKAIDLQVSLQLMRADFNARYDAGGNELDYKEIRQYHEDYGDSAFYSLIGRFL